MTPAPKQTTQPLSVLTHVAKDGSIVQVKAPKMKNAYRILLNARGVKFERVCQ